MSTPGATNLVIRVAVADAASVPIAKINEGLVGTGAAATAGSARTVAALGRTDVALVGTAAKAAALGEANTAAATAAAGAWTRTSSAIASSGTAIASTGKRVAEATELMKPLLKMVALFGAVKFFGDIIDEGKQGVLATRLVTQAFGSAKAEVMEFGEKASKAFGMSASDAEKMTVKFGNYLISLGQAGPELATMSMNLTTITANMAKFNGVSTEQAAADLTMGLRGRGQALKAYGVDISTATIQAEAVKEGLLGTDSSGRPDPMTARIKNMALYGTISAQTARMMEAQSKSEGSLSKTQDQVTSSIANMEEELGKKVVPILAASASVINNDVVPAFKAIFSVVNVVFSVFNVLPAPVKTAVGALLVMLALKIPLTALFSSISMGLVNVAASSAFAGTAIERFFLSIATGVEAIAPWLVLIGVVVVTLMSLIHGNNDAAMATENHAAAVNTLTQAYTASNGVMNENIRQAALLAIQQAKWGDDNKQTDLTKYVDSLAAVGIARRDAVDAVLGEPAAQAKMNAGYQKEVDAINKVIEAHTRRGQGRTVVDQEGRDAQGRLDVLNSEKKGWDALYGAQSDALDNYKKNAEATKVENDKILAGLPPLTEQIDLLSGAWSTMTSDVDSAIAALDKLAGRTPDVAAATKSMYDALRAQRNDAKVGQSGAERLDPNRILNSAGEIDTKSDAGSRLYGTTQSARSAILASGMANYRQELLTTKDPAKSKSDLAAFLAKMLPQEASTLTSIFGDNKTAADKAMKALGMTPADMQKVIIDQVAKTIADEQKKKDDAGDPSATPSDPAAGPSVDQGMLTSALNGPAAVAAAKGAAKGAVGPYLPGANGGNSTMLGGGGGAFAPANADAAGYKANLAKIPSVVTTTIIANTNQADTALTGLGQKLSAVTGAPNPATAAPGSPGAPSTSGTIMANFGAGSSTYNEQVPSSAASAVLGAPGGSTYNEQVPTGGNKAGTKWGPSVEKWRPLGLQALKMMGEPASEIDDVLYRINLESTGNPNAVNNWDSNAKKGTPSKGLVQVIDPTFHDWAVKGYNTNIWDPLSNVLAGMNWSKHEYGSVAAGFERGGSYDNGGFLMPGGMAFSQLSTPEPILTPAQWKVAESAVHHVEATVNAGAHRPDVVVHFTVNGNPDDSTLEVFRENLRQVLSQEYERAF